MSTRVDSPHVDVYLLLVVMPDNSIRDLGDRHVLGLSFGLHTRHEWPFNVEGPALGRGGGVIGVGQEVLAPEPPASMSRTSPHPASPWEIIPYIDL